MKNGKHFHGEGVLTVEQEPVAGEGRACLGDGKLISEPGALGVGTVEGQMDPAGDGSLSGVERGRCEGPPDLGHAHRCCEVVEAKRPITGSLGTKLGPQKAGTVRGEEVEHIHEMV